MNGNLCTEHSGFKADIKNLQKDRDDQWLAISGLRNKMDDIMAKINVLLGMVSVALLGLIADIVLRITK